MPASAVLNPPLPAVPRRTLLSAGIMFSALAAALTASRAQGETLLSEWGDFTQRYLTPDGRVVDTGNQGVSHSEGQGYGMLMAEAVGDRAAFDRMLAWTRRTLKRPQDNLHAWRFVPNQGLGINDFNNATDGDLYIAWALLRAHERWPTLEYRRIAQAITRDVLRACVVAVERRVVLLPGVEGFRRGSHVVINPSYYAFQALRAVAVLEPSPHWARVEADGLAILRDSRFGRWELPPDWLALPQAGGRSVVAPGWPARFSWDAVRVPLNLAWSGLTEEPGLRASADFWLHPEHRAMPAWVDLLSGVTAPYPAPTGIQAVAALAMAALTGRRRLTGLPRVRQAHDYYNAALIMKVRMACRDTRVEVG